MLRFLAALPLVFLAAIAPAAAADVVPVSPGVVIPWGDWLVALVTGVVMPLLWPVVAALAVWIFGQLVRLVPWLQRFITAQLVERLLTNVLDFAVNAVADAAKGRTMTASTGRVVLDVAFRRAIEVGSPALIKAIGGPEELGAMIFRRMDLEPEATVADVLEPVLLTRLPRL